MGILYYQDNIRMSLNIGYTLNNNFNGEHDDKPSRVGAPNVQTKPSGNFSQSKWIPPSWNGRYNFHAYYSKMFIDFTGGNCDRYH